MCSCRFVVTLEDGRVVGLRPANLVPDPRPQPPSGANGSPLLGEVDDLSASAAAATAGFAYSRSPRQQRASGSGAAAVAALQRNHQTSSSRNPQQQQQQGGTNPAAALGVSPLGKAQLPPMRPRSAGQSRSSDYRG